MPPSASETLTPGNLWNTSENSRSANAAWLFVPINEIHTAIGPSRLGIGT